MSNDRGWKRYNDNWGNYKSDLNKSKKILKEEIRDILTQGTFNKIDLIDIRDFAKNLGFEDQMLETPKDDTKEALVDSAQQNYSKLNPTGVLENQIWETHKERKGQ